MEILYLAVTVTAIIGLFIFTRLRRRKRVQIFNASITVEELEYRAKRSAQDHAITKTRKSMNWPITHMNESYKVILDIYSGLNDDLNHKKAVPPAAEWLLDNFYIIEEQVKAIRTELVKKTYHKLPILKKGPYQGYTRVFAIAMEFVSGVDGQIEESTLQKFLQGYQEHTILFDREIRMIPLMLRLALIENVRTKCEAIKETRYKWRMANNIVDKWLNDDSIDNSKMIKLFKSASESFGDIDATFIEHLFYRLRRSGRSYSEILKYFDEHLEVFGTSAERIAQQEHNTQANITVAMGNYFMSFRYVSSINWSELFDHLSFVEQILLKDPRGYYAGMDLTSRGRYLQQVEIFARKYGVSELHVARLVVELADLAEKQMSDVEQPTNLMLKKTHVGYYLLDDGTLELEALQKGKKSTQRQYWISWFTTHLGSVFISVIALFTGLIILAAFKGAIETDPSSSSTLFIRSNYWLLQVLTGLLLIIPASEIAIALNNWLISSVTRPAFFPRLELKEGIPKEMKTIVVMPAILNHEMRVIELLGHLENHYLANRGENLYFALIGAYKDTKQQDEIENRQILNCAIQGIADLNRKYSDVTKGNTEEIFYFYHRRSIYNEVDKIWTGWERKRGALMEFNEMLLGSTTTSFIPYSGNQLNGSDIKYIITLDADTILPFDMAQKMVGTMAHPLNLPIVDLERHIVVKGYGLMQPRISFDMESSNKSIFAKIYTGMVGLDPYAGAVSDVYQDLFGEGIFTGKGIYDLKIFNQILKDAVPENTVLSHDLLEGSYVRAALVSDLELIDAYPSKYNAYATRLQRWIRGDWQLITWLNRIIHNRKERLIINPLKNISIWKIFDNLRRSLVAPASLILIFFSFTLLPGSNVFWLGFISIMFWFPLALAIMNQISFVNFGNLKSKRHMSGFFGLKAHFFQILLSITFLPFQAFKNIKAICVTLIRVFFTHKKMLEWITSDDAEKMQSDTLSSYVRTMGGSAMMGVPLMGLTVVFKPALFPISILIGFMWFLSPLIAYLVSKDANTVQEPLSLENISDLRKIARRTWRYFEEYANSKNNFLAPDNYQEVPYKGIAHRTSPTNIGLGMLATTSAHDFGFIGIEEALLNVERTVTTIEKLDKWHGHLLNWYDTKTLLPLKPRYISTVDSGNYVCYLITVVEALKAFEKQPLVKRCYEKGLYDTYRNSLVGGYDYFEHILKESEGVLNEDDTIDILKWHHALSIFSTSPELNMDLKSAWIGKTKTQCDAFKRELENFMPWIMALSNIPGVLRMDVFHDQLTELLEILSVNRSIVDLNDVLNPIRLMINAIKIKLNQLSQEEKETVNVWLDHLLETVKLGINNARLFKEKVKLLTNRIEKLSDETRFCELYDARRQLFSIGYNLEDNRLTNSFYDLLASEARQTSYIAIARGEVPAKHWQQLGRSLTMIDRYKGLVSWSGTMFEYFMPLLIMKSYKNTLLDETYSFVIKSQKKYGEQRKMPWGASESAFNSLDLHLDYQYKAIGVPWLGLKRGLIDDAVVAPYATFLALMIDPIEAYKNIERLKKDGLEGQYGFYEAADYTPERLANNEKSAVIKSYMAHHQGMILLSLNNYIHKNILQERFFNNAYAKSARLLLQEKVPMHVVFTKEKKEKIMHYKGPLYTDSQSIRHYTRIDAGLPKAHVLSNGFYSVMTTDKGTGYSKTKDLAVSRWREDAVLDQYGSFFYIKNLESQTAWSSTYAPYNVNPNAYEVTFTGDKTTYKRTEGDIEASTEIIVTSGDNAEIRRIKVKNIGDSSAAIELISYFEIVMAEQNSDVSHRAFSNLFVETEFDDQRQALIAHRRSRKPSEPSKWIAEFPVIDGKYEGHIDYETDRMQFIGRGNTLKNPQMMQRDRPLTKSIGTVLDPIFAFRLSLNIKAKHSIRISFVTLIAESKEGLLELIDKYNNHETCDAAFWLAVIRSQVETRYLNIKAPEMMLYQDMISDILFLSPMRLKRSDMISKNTLNQSALWKFSISGDRPILLLTIEKVDDVEILYEILKAHEYWRLKDLRVDLVIVLKEENDYYNTLQNMVNDIVESTQTMDIIRLRGDVFVLNINHMSVDELNLLHAVARMSFSGEEGTMEDQFLNSHDGRRQSESQRYQLQKEVETMPLDNFDEKSLQFFNGIGGFNQKGDAYVIRLENQQMTPLPWSNVIANENFGFVTTEMGGGYTWYGNSRENKLTPWSNDAVSDAQGEIIYIGEYQENHLELWSMTPNPIRNQEPYTVEHGFGYSKYLHASHGITQELIQFVPLNDAVKISLITLSNESNQERILTLTYYVKPVLGVEPSQTAMHLKSELDLEGVLKFTNAYNHEFKGQVLYMGSSSEEISVCADRNAFFGLGDERLPHALLKEKGLTNLVGSCLDPCGVIQFDVILKPGEQKKCVLLLGLEENELNVSRRVMQYKHISYAELALKEVKSLWADKLSVIQVNTPDVAMNIMLNGWLIYQVITCRMWARTAFYQAGGAFGFRDQLQDCLSLLTIWPELAKSQILKHAAHQFVEGDVLHWWHEPAEKGPRTRISDDYLWLPYVVAEYVRVTGDVSILDVHVPFLADAPLAEHEEERYSSPTVSNSSASIYQHCLRALNHGLNFGIHGLPLMEGGDWNDGMNLVGIEGKGESIWLGWFLFKTLKDFIPHMFVHGDHAEALIYQDIALELAKSIDTFGWDGKWYKRAYFDDGSAMGSESRSECKIDAIAQAWSVISGAGDADKMTRAMSAVESYLISKEDGLIKLLTPPFDRSEMEPGYIKGYVPGVRENGGQYTHGATWVIAAYAMMGEGDKAHELFELINPINHTNTYREMMTYKAEPYVMAADVYSQYPHVGRGGWTWYTGAAGWMYQTGIEHILGFRREGAFAFSNPNAPQRWVDVKNMVKYKGRL